MKTTFIQTFVILTLAEIILGFAPSWAGIDYSIWQLQEPSGSGNSPTIISSSQMEGGYSDAYFYTASDNGQVFMDTQTGITTSGSVHPRCEMREMTTGGADAAWAMTGYNLMTVTGQMLMLGDGSTGKTTIGQVFNSTGDIPLLEFQYAGSLGGFEVLYEEAKGGGTSTNLKVPCALNTQYTFTLSLSNSALAVTINGVQVYTYTPSSAVQGDQFYFKFGDYDQTATAGSVSTVPYTEVEDYGVTVYHGSNPPTSTSTPTVLAAQTATDTMTATSTASSTVSATYTSTQANTATFTLTHTPTLAMTATSTPTLTATATSTNTPGTTTAQTATSTLTGTVGAAFTSTPTTTSTSTPQITVSLTDTPTSTLPPVSSATFTSTTVFTSTPTLTFSVTSTFTSTDTTIPNTSTPTATSTNSATAPFTETATATSSSTNTHAPTGTSTSTLTVTVTATPTRSVPVVYPNPVNGDTVTVGLPESGMSKVSVRIYTTSFRLAQTLDLGTVLGNSVPVSLIDRAGIKLANGLYYLRVQANGKNWIVKLLVLR